MKGMYNVYGGYIHFKLAIVLKITLHRVDIVTPYQTPYQRYPAFQLISLGYSRLLYSTVTLLKRSPHIMVKYTAYWLFGHLVVRIIRVITDYLTREYYGLYIYDWEK